MIADYNALYDNKRAESVTYTHYILTEYEVRTGKHLPEIIVQTGRRSGEVCAEKAEGKYFPVQTEVNKE